MKKTMLNIVRDYTIKTEYNASTRSYQTQVKRYDCNFDIVKISFNEKTAKKQHKQLVKDCKKANDITFLNMILNKTRVVF